MTRTLRTLASLTLGVWFLLSAAVSAPAHAVAPHTQLTTVAPITATAPLMTQAYHAQGQAEDPADPADPAGPNEPGPAITLEINGEDGTPDSSIVIILALTILSIAPSILLMTTAFTKIFVVLSITRNALGLQAVPPNQVIAGMALFLSLFIMAPVLTEVNDVAVQPYLKGEMTQTQAFDEGVVPMREFMLDHTRPEDLALITRAADRENPANREEVPLDTMVPAFVLSELRAGFIIGFMIFIPFLIIDIVVASALMSMGMMMLPPIIVSLPFKLLLFILVDGWTLIIQAVVGSYN